MSDTSLSSKEQLLKKQVRDSGTLLERLEESRRRIGRMCSERRGPRMTIPVEWSDDDFYICLALEDAIAQLADEPADVLEPAYHTLPQHIIDKVNEVRIWFARHGIKHWRVAGVQNTEGPEIESAFDKLGSILNGHDHRISPMEANALLTNWRQLQADARASQPPPEADCGCPHALIDGQWVVRHNYCSSIAGAAVPPSELRPDELLAWQCRQCEWINLDCASETCVGCGVQRIAVTKSELCSECRQPLPPLARWSMPACPACVEKAEAAKSAVAPDEALERDWQYAPERTQADWNAMPCAGRQHDTATQFHTPGTPCPLPPPETKECLHDWRQAFSGGVGEAEECSRCHEVREKR